MRIEAERRHLRERLANILEAHQGLPAVELHGAIPVSCDLIEEIVKHLDREERQWRHRKNQRRRDRNP